MEIREYQKGDEIKIYELFESTFEKKLVQIIGIGCLLRILPN